MLCPLTLVLLAASADPLGSTAAVELRYVGRLTPVAVADAAAEEKGFSVTWCLDRSDDGRVDAAFVVSEETAALPWPERFGFGDPQGGERGPAVGYRYDGKEHVLALPGAALPQADRLASGAPVVDGPFKFVSGEEASVAGRECRLVSVSTNFGLDRTVAVEKSTGLIVRQNQTVFLGRGDRFKLTLELAEQKPLDAPALAGRGTVLDGLRRISQVAEEAGDLDHAAVSTFETIATLADPLDEPAAGTPFADLVAAISRDMSDRERRAAGIEGAAKRIVGSPAPPLNLQTLDAAPIDPEALAGKVVLLHFWQYDGTSPEAPFGQAGYLDFLHRKHGERVAVVGVAVNPAFGDPAAAAKAARSAKGFAEFLNLGYPLAADDGTLLDSFGDPRDLGATLPLWIVIDADGVVRSYKAGLYDVAPHEGLKTLDDLVTGLVHDTESGI